jgi:UTP--glucose-1-phosphate uridylyltransferase
MENREVKKAVITAGGRGTRFLPATKVIPKELIPIGNYPTIHYLLEECKQSGIEEVCIVVRERGSLTEQYFEPDLELREYLQEKGKDNLLERVENPNLGLKLTFIEQDKSLPVGHGAPLMSAKDFVDGDDFAFMFCDDLVKADTPALKKVLETWKSLPELSGVVMGAEVPMGEIHRFSTVKFKGEKQVSAAGEETEVGLLEDFIEKPQTEAEVFEPLCFIGRAAYSSKIFEHLQQNLEDGKVAAGEFSAWDAMVSLAQEQDFGVVTHGKWLTTGTPEQMKRAQKEILDL